jgi:pimeloyl-ACP methyl ester carboxylesterase
VLNGNKEKLQCSYFREVRQGSPRPLVVYLHGNSASRLSCFKVLKVVLPLGLELACLDFSGCGLSEGEYVTLGMKESSDLKALLDHMIKTYGTREIVLWGRSMGAVTALLHAQQFPCTLIKGLILDSPFGCFKDLLYELADRHVPILPRFLVDIILENVRETVLDKTGLDIFTHGPLFQMDRCRTPVLFIVGEEDTLIVPSHS